MPAGSNLDQLATQRAAPEAERVAAASLEAEVSILMSGPFTTGERFKAVQKLERSKAAPAQGQTAPRFRR
jgi:hypothetical protein